jgi:hypothetical protein
VVVCFFDPADTDTLECVFGINGRHPDQLKLQEIKAAQKGNLLRRFFEI